MRFWAHIIRLSLRAIRGFIRFVKRLSSLRVQYSTSKSRERGCIRALFLSSGVLYLPLVLQGVVVPPFAGRCRFGEHDAAVMKRSSFRLRGRMCRWTTKWSGTRSDVNAFQSLSQSRKGVESPRKVSYSTSRSVISYRCLITSALPLPSCKSTSPYPGLHPPEDHPTFSCHQPVLQDVKSRRDP